VKKLILMSIMIATLALPMFYAARPLAPPLTVRMLQRKLVWFCVFYVLAVLYVLPRLP
jgi:hypothetical protein